MKKYLSLLFFFCLFSAQGKAQNLVPNYSFENITQCPTNISQVYLASPWFQPCTHNGNTFNSSSTDIFDSCSSYAMFGVPTNICGFQPARNGGYGYAGLFLHETTNNYREYLEVPLLAPLTANRKYCLEFYLSLSYPCGAVSNCGAFFSTDSLLDTTNLHTINYVTPQIQNPTTNMLSDTANWMLVSGNFIALGGEKFMTIGNFNLPANTNIIELTPGCASAYYYVDDVSVIDCTEVGVGEVNEDAINIFPNPATNSITLTTKNQELKNIHIYNVVGKCVKEIPRCAQNDKEIEISGFANGIYFVEVLSEKGIQRQKLVKQ